MNEETKEKMLNLLADRAVFGLTPEENSELEKLLEQYPSYAADSSFELAAAAISLSNLEIESELPPNLEAGILRQAENHFSTIGEESKRVDFAAAPSAASGFENSGDKAQAPWWSWLGWGLAAAACVALIVNIWQNRVAPGEVAKTPETTKTPAPLLTDAQKREQLIAQATDLARAEWAEANPKDEIQASGDIVWSAATQKGFMRFRNLPVNDKSKETYQLWIFDENQSDKTPVDGGIFDVNENGEIIVPINAKLNIKSPKMFAVTREKAGGVVVSDRTKIVAIAKI